MHMDAWGEATLVDLGWQQAELAELADLKRRAAELPATAPRALLSIRLSILTEETTSPVRQELDLYRMAVERGSRPVGVARDLNVSATKVPPWKRPELGNWINNKTPEFDEILFWKLDRFVRRISDLHMMIEWCKEYSKTLAAKHDPIDLSTEFGQFMVTIIAGMARIEAANTGTRVESLWQFARTAERWVIGKPTYGYASVDDGKGAKKLVIVPEKARVLKWVYKVVTRRHNPLSLYRVCKILNRTDIKPPRGGEWMGGNLKSILTNPSLMGYRVFRTKGQKARQPPNIAYDLDGQPIMVAEGIFTPEEFRNLSRALEERSNKRTKTSGKRTKFLGVIKHGPCGENVYEQQKTWKTVDGTKKKKMSLRCRAISEGRHCPGGEFTNPANIYGSLKSTVLAELGHYEVVHRTYARGTESLARKVELETSIRHYLSGLEPGGRFAVGGFVERQAMETLNALNAELETIDPDSTTDRWIYESKGASYASHWETEGIEAMEKDLLRAGITFILYDGYAELKIPEDIQDRLVVKTNHFEEKKF